jgi:hypothetical protein
MAEKPAWLLLAGPIMAHAAFDSMATVRLVSGAEACEFNDSANNAAVPLRLTSA